MNESKQRVSSERYQDGADEEYHATSDAIGDTANRIGGGALRRNFLLQAREIQQLIVRRALHLIRWNFVGRLRAADIGTRWPCDRHAHGPDLKRALSKRSPKLTMNGKLELHFKKYDKSIPNSRADRRGRCQCAIEGCPAVPGSLSVAAERAPTCPMQQPPARPADSLAECAIGEFSGRSGGSGKALLPDRRPHRRRWGGRRRNRKGEPHVPAFRAVLGGEFLVALQVQEALGVADRENVAQLRPDAEHP